MPFVPRGFNGSTSAPAIHTSARQAFKILTSRIHPQLPLSQRESRKLLDIVKTSFREQLDKEHPPNASNDAQKPEHAALPAPASGKAPLTSSRMTTDEHLQNILTNPLFAIKPNKQSNASLPSPLSSTDPLKWFNQEVAAGAGTYKKAEICLQNSVTLGYLIPDASGETPARKHGVARSILNWLKLDGKDVYGLWSFDAKAALHLTQFVLAEEREDIVWSWIKSHPHTPEKRRTHASRDKMLWKAKVLNVLINMEMAKSTDSGLTIFLRSIDFLAGEDPMNEFTPTKVAHTVFSHLIKPSGSKLNVCSPDLYEEVIQRAPYFTRTPEFFKAHLWLLHPTNPVTLLAMDFIDIAQEKDDARTYKEHKAPLYPRGIFDWVEIFHFDLMSRLLEAGKNADAMKILEKTRARKTRAHTPKLDPKAGAEIKDSNSEVNKREEAQSLNYLRSLGLT